MKTITRKNRTVDDDEKLLSLSSDVIVESYLNVIGGSNREKTISNFINMLLFEEDRSMLLLFFLLMSMWTREISSEAAEGLKPFDFFVGPATDLAKEIPLAFRPDDGFKLREAYSKKYGHRGERLIAMLGGGNPKVPPIAVYDASLFDEQNQVQSAKKLLKNVKNKKIHSPIVSHENLDSYAAHTLNSGRVVDLESTGVVPKENAEEVIFKRLYAAMYNQAMGNAVLSTTVLPPSDPKTENPPKESANVVEKESSILVRAYSYD